MIWLTSRLNLNPSEDRTVIVDRSLVVRLRFSVGPIQDDVGGGHQLHSNRVRIDGIHSRVQRIVPNAFFSSSYDVAVLEGVSGNIFSRFSYIGNHYSDVGNRDCCHGLNFDGCKHRVDKIAACQHDLFLQSFVAARVDKSLRILEGIVVFDFRPGNFAGG